MVVTWLSHTSFIAFLAFVLTVFPLSLVFPYPQHIRGMAAVIATIGASILTLDAYVYFNLGYHLNASALPEIISLLWHRLTNSPALTTLLAGSIVLLILGFQLTVSNFTWHHLARLKQFKFARYAGSFLVICFALSHSIHIWADANLSLISPSKTTYCHFRTLLQPKVYSLKTTYWMLKATNRHIMLKLITKVLITKYLPH